MTPSVASYIKRAEGWAARARASRFFAAGVGGAVLVAFADQLSKAWILYGIKLPDRRHIEISTLFDLSFVQNYGASFGMLSGSPAAPVILSLVAMAVAAALVHWLPSATRRLTVAGVALILGGAIGNLIDRLRFGYVIDFLDFRGFPFPHIRLTETFPFLTLHNGGFIWVFNVADAAINIGIALLIVDWLRHRKKENRG